MTDATTSQTARKNDLVLVKETNEWGQITDLDKNATYFVIRKPTKELTQQKSREFVEDVRSFLHEHRVLSEKQFEELNSRYGEPAKAKAKELRETMEKKFDEIAKEFESRVEQLENEYKTRFAKGSKTEASHGSGVETPGEMPRGDTHASSTTTTATSTASNSAEPSKTGAAKKTGAKKTE